MSKVAMYVQKEKQVFKAIKFTDDTAETLMNIQKFMLVDELRISYEDPKHPIIILSHNGTGYRFVSMGDYIYRDPNTEEISVMGAADFNNLYELRV